MRIFVICAGILLVGCASARYPNWQYVRIEQSVPSDACEYKIQEACSHPGATCYNWYKQRATKYGANTVVITQASKDISASGKSMTFQGSGGSNTEVNTNLTALADYYYCPGNKIAPVK